MKYFFIAFFLSVVAVVSWAGFRGHKFERPPVQIFNDMDLQAKAKPQQANDFFADGRVGRIPVTGTVPIGFEPPRLAAQKGGKPESFGFSNAPDYYNTGKFGDYFGEGFPEEVQITPVFLKRGQDRFNIHCTVCHGVVGNGKGVTSKYGILNAANFLSDEFTTAGGSTYRAEGSIFDTITHGRGLMGPYGANISVQDRWAIVAYIRALQSAAKAAGVKG